MKRRRSFRQPDPAVQAGISAALRESFAEAERQADAEMQRLIDMMMKFEGAERNDER